MSYRMECKHKIPLELTDRGDLRCGFCAKEVERCYHCGMRIAPYESEFGEDWATLTDLPDYHPCDDDDGEIVRHVPGGWQERGDVVWVGPDHEHEWGQWIGVNDKHVVRQCLSHPCQTMQEGTVDATEVRSTSPCVICEERPAGYTIIRGSIVCLDCVDTVLQLHHTRLEGA